MHTKPLTEILKTNRAISTILFLLKKNNQILDEGNDFLKPVIRFSHKGTQTELQYTAPVVLRNEKKDRIFPLESVDIQSFKQKHDAELTQPFIHSGGWADELTRSLNVVALTIGRDIYFRNGAYKPETEKGRSILAHELTHVQQYNEKRIQSSTDRKALEAEAEKAEYNELYDPDPIVKIELCGEYFHIRKSFYPKLLNSVADDIEEWIQSQRDMLSEEEYLKLLCNYKNWRESAL